MATAKPFSWVVRFTVAPLWVADGFAMTDERALDMLAKTIGFGTGEELQAVVLEAPSPVHVARVQGYTGKHPNTGAIMRQLAEGTPHDAILRSALMSARRLLDSVAFVAKAGDTSTVLEKIDAALDAVDTRRGEPVLVEE